MLAVFVVFCRIGGTVMLMPALGTLRVPVRVRLFIAVAVSLGLSPLLAPLVVDQVEGAGVFALLALIARELLFGALIGLLARALFMALEALLAASAMAVGFTAPPGTVTDQGEPVPALVTLILSAAAVLWFQTGLHLELVRGLITSYSVVPPEAVFRPRIDLVEVVDRLDETFLFALQITSPFLIYALVVNLALGIVNKLTPQIPVFFVGLPFILAGGLAVLWATGDRMLVLFTGDMADWLRRG